jgi:hypothetical protein
MAARRTHFPPFLFLGRWSEGRFFLGAWGASGVKTCVVSMAILLVSRGTRPPNYIHRKPGDFRMGYCTGQTLHFSKEKMKFSLKFSRTGQPAFLSARLPQAGKASG